MAYLKLNSFYTGTLIRLKCFDDIEKNLIKYLIKDL